MPSAALYEWNYPRQMLAIAAGRATTSVNLYSDDFLLSQAAARSACRAPGDTLLLIDEIDRADYEFEAFLLEFLSDFSNLDPGNAGRSARCASAGRCPDLEPDARSA